MQTESLALKAQPSFRYVPESAFGLWFLGTQTWATRVLKRAILDLEALIPGAKPQAPVILDIGCGWGHSVRLLHETFRPRHFVGVDIDPKMLASSAREAKKHGYSAEFRPENIAQMSVGNASVDIVFCHQTFHHLVDQERALAEIFRVLKPGGLLLFAESTRVYIHSWIIRLLFRHDMSVQRSAPEYLDMIRAAGFQVPRSAISYPYLWWSRSDLGLLEAFSLVSPSKDREETLINLVAVKT